jgi:hypothetical protein
MKMSILDMMAIQPNERNLDWLKSSLQAAIELELSTLPPYLCALWSIKDTVVGSPGKVVYDLIDSVVRQEMTHMGLVCNLLTGIGGRPEIVKGYVDHIAYPGPLPGGVRPELIVYLSGLTKPYLHDVMMQIEFPENGPIPIAAAQAFPTIGDFYDAIQDVFATLAPTINSAVQLSSLLVGVAPITDLQGAADAISLIKSQGEGTPNSPFDGSDLAHYYRFAEIYVGAKLIVAPGGGFAFHGDPIPFPATQTMAPVPKGGYVDAPANVAPLLDTFSTLFSNMLDNLDKAWQTSDSSALAAAAMSMRQLRSAARNILQQPLPGAVDGFYGPDFRCVAPRQRKMGSVPSDTAPKFADVVNLLASLTGNDPNIDDAPTELSGNWSTTPSLRRRPAIGACQEVSLSRAIRTTQSSAWRWPVSRRSALRFPKMPDVASDPNGRSATSVELQLVARGITNICQK